MDRYGQMYQCTKAPSPKVWVKDVVFFDQVRVAEVEDDLCRRGRCGGIFDIIHAGLCLAREVQVPRN